MTIDHWIIDASHRNPTKTALEFGEQRISYSSFAALIDKRVSELEKAGVKRSDRIAWYGLNHPEVFVLLFSCARLGAIFVPLNWRLAEPEVAAIVANCEPTLLFYDKHFAKQALSLPDVQTIALSNSYQAKSTQISTDRENTDSTHSQATCLESATIQSAPDTIEETKTASIDFSKHAKHTDVDLNQPVLLVYTSGSTGLPKGALLSQNAIICNAAMSIEAHGMSDADVALVVLPLFHVGGMNILPTPAFSVGASVILHERFEPDKACQSLNAASLAITVPTVLNAMMSSSYWNKIDFSSIRAISIGSTDVPSSLINSLHSLGVPAPQIYGATETAPFAIYQTLDNAMQSSGSIGRAGSACNIRLVTDGNDVAVDEPGEVWVKGNNVLTSYWQDPELTAQALQDGWFRTGDVATCDASGFYWFNDRIKHVIISGGENIFPSEIERILRAVPDVADVSVVGKPDAKWGEIPVAVVVSKSALNKSDILLALEGQLARYKHPKEVVFVDALPRNAMGKVVAASVRKLV